MHWLRWQNLRLLRAQSPRTLAICLKLFRRAHQMFCLVLCVSFLVSSLPCKSCCALPFSHLPGRLQWSTFRSSPPCMLAAAIFSSWRCYTATATFPRVSGPAPVPELSELGWATPKIGFSMLQQSLQLSSFSNLITFFRLKIAEGIFQAKFPEKRSCQVLFWT